MITFDDVLLTFWLTFIVSVIILIWPDNPGDN